MTDLDNRRFDRILLVKPSSLGDVVHALPVLHGLRTRFPKARIDWLVASPFAPLLDGHDELDELIKFDRRRFSLIGLSPRITGEFVAFIRNLRRRRYELVLDLQGLFRTGWITWTTRAPVRIGFRDAREGAWVFYNHRIIIEDPNVHAVDRNYLVARLLGFDDVPVEFRLTHVESTRSQTLDLLRETGVTKDQQMVAVAPGARGETKVWPWDRFAKTIDRLHGIDGVRCVLLGSPDEKSLCERIADACESEPVNLAGLTNLAQLAALIALADVVLCHDSATVHLAVASHRPVVCLIGPTNPLRTGPYHRLEDVVHAGVKCSPCYLRRLSQCPHDHRCMHELPVDQVVAAVKRSLARRAVF